MTAPRRDGRAEGVDPFVRELDELVARAGSLPRGAVATVRAVLEALLADELDPPERDSALRTLSTSSGAPNARAVPGEQVERFAVTIQDAQDSDLYDALVRLLRPRQGAPRRAGIAYEEVAPR